MSKKRAVMTTYYPERNLLAWLRGGRMLRSLLIGTAIAGVLAFGIPTVTSAQESADQHVKKAGKQAKKAGKATGEAAKEAGKATGEAAKKTGQVTKDAAKETGTGTKKLAKKVGRK